MSAVALAPRSSVRRFSPTPSRTNRPFPKTTGASAPQLGTPQSDGPQWEGGLAVRSGLMILPAIGPELYRFGLILRRARRPPRAVGRDWQPGPPGSRLPRARA